METGVYVIPSSDRLRSFVRLDIDRSLNFAPARIQRQEHILDHLNWELLKLSRCHKNCELYL
jgi:NADH/NAD ratio-sensing transcriptional regulator Rex